MLAAGSYIPHISDGVFRQFRAARADLLATGGIGILRHAEQCEHLALKVGQLGLEGADDPAIVVQDVALHEGIEAEDLLCGGALGGPLLRVQGEAFNILVLHLAS